jgi:hypothetical protein
MEDSMNYLKVARLNQISVDLEGHPIPASERAFNEPEAHITINDDDVGRLSVSLIKNHNNVLLLRPKSKEHSHLVFCVNLKSISAAGTKSLLPKPPIVEVL